MKPCTGRRKSLLSALICANLRPVLAFILFLFLPSVSNARDFTAKSLGDYGNVTVMEAAGNYDAMNSDGTLNDLPRQNIAKEFFKNHKDEYDFLVVFSNFDFQMPDAEAKAFYLQIKNDVQGIGLPIFNNSFQGEYGSDGKLQGMIDLGNIGNLITDPLNFGFEETLRLLNHEFLHRWSSYVKFKDINGTLSTALLGRDGSHWSFLFDTRDSLQFGNWWQDNGNGTFTSLVPMREMKYFSPLDLYLMGFYDKAKVPPMLLIENPNVDPTRLPEAGVTISGTARYVTIDDIIAAEGPRTPDAASSQKTFKTAFIFITTPGTFRGDEVYGIENIRNGGVTRFSVLTDGAAVMQVASTPKEDVPVNPGNLPPPTTPRTLPPDINDGVTWLMNNQKTDGSWEDNFSTRQRDTAEAVLVLKNFIEAQQNYALGIQWLGSASSG